MSGASVAELPKEETETPSQVTLTVPFEECKDLVKEVDVKLVCGQRTFLTELPSTDYSCKVTASGSGPDLVIEVRKPVDDAVLSGTDALKDYLGDNLWYLNLQAPENEKEYVLTKTLTGVGQEAYYAESVSENETSRSLAFLSANRVISITGTGKLGEGCLGPAKLQALGKIIENNQRKVKAGVIFS